jgi:hypothetical protein
MTNIETLKVKLTGTRPLLLCNGELANPFNPALPAIKALSQKKDKTLEDHEKLSQLQFEAGCYFDEALGVYLPSSNLFKALQEGAAKFKEGLLVKSSLLVRGLGANGGEPDALGSTILPDGRCTPRELYHKDNGKHVFRRMAKPQGRTSILSTRPIFEEWEVRFQLEFTGITSARVLEYFKISGRFKGLGTWRPVFGTFETNTI